MEKKHFIQQWNCKIIIVFLLMIASHHLQAKKITVGVGNFEPFFDEKNKSGLFFDLVKEVFKNMPGYEPTYIFMSNTRLQIEIENKNIDVACNIFKKKNESLFLSLPFFKFTDVAVTLKKNKIVISEIKDLKDRSIIAYQGATDLLGSDFKKMANANINYSEHPIPFVTTKKLLRTGTEVRIGDVFIFLHDLKKLRELKKIKLKITDFDIHYLWDDVFSYIAFKDKHTQEMANKAIGVVKKSGRYKEIYQKYERIFTQKEMLPAQK
jgi:ABC-type amino acid transport substrate-binding protein